MQTKQKPKAEVQKPADLGDKTKLPFDSKGTPYSSAYSAAYGGASEGYLPKNLEAQKVQQAKDEAFKKSLENLTPAELQQQWEQLSQDRAALNAEKANWKTQQALKEKDSQLAHLTSKIGEMNEEIKQMKAERKKEKEKQAKIKPSPATIQKPAAQPTRAPAQKKSYKPTTLPTGPAAAAPRTATVTKQQEAEPVTVAVQSAVEAATVGLLRGSGASVTYATTTRNSAGITLTSSGYTIAPKQQFVASKSFNKDSFDEGIGKVAYVKMPNGDVEIYKAIFDSNDEFTEYKLVETVAKDAITPEIAEKKEEKKKDEGERKPAEVQKEPEDKKSRSIFKWDFVKDLFQQKTN